MINKWKYILYVDGVVYIKFTNIFSAMLFKFKNIKWLINHDYKISVKI